MLGLFKKINRLLCEPIHWTPDLESDRNFITKKYPKSECYLRMNDFPDEPLWTLFYKGESKDIEDTPTLWKVKYRSKEPLI